MSGRAVRARLLRCRIYPTLIDHPARAERSRADARRRLQRRKSDLGSFSSLCRRRRFREPWPRVRRARRSPRTGRSPQGACAANPQRRSDAAPDAGLSRRAHVPAARWGTSRCSAASRRSRRAPTSRRPAKRATRRSRGAPPRSRVGARARALSIESARLWSDIDPAATAAETGDRGARDRRRREGIRQPRRGQRPQGGARAGARRGRALAGRRWAKHSCSSTGCSRTSPTSRRRCGSSNRSRSRIPTSPKRASPSRSPRYNTGLNELSTSATALREIDRALILKPGWERAAMLKAEILGKRSPAEAIKYLRRLHEGRIRIRRPLPASLAQFYVEQKRYAEARAIFERFWAADKSNRDYEFAIAALAVQMKDWDGAEKLFEDLKRGELRRERRRRALSRADRRGNRPLRARVSIAIARCRTASARGSRNFAPRRCSRSRIAWPRRAAISPTCRRSRSSSASRCARPRRSFCATPATTPGAYAVLTQALVEQPGSARSSLRHRDGRRKARQDRRRRSAAHAADRAQPRERAGAERAGLHARRPHAAHRGRLRADRARAQARAQGPVHPRQHGLGAVPDGQPRRRPRTISGARSPSGPDAEIAAHLGEVLWAKGEQARARGSVAVAVEDHARQSGAARDDAPPRAVTVVARARPGVEGRGGAACAAVLAACAATPSRPPPSRVARGRRAVRDRRPAVRASRHRRRSRPISAGGTRRRATNSSCRRRSGRRSREISRRRRDAALRAATVRRPRRGRRRLVGADRTRARRRRCPSRGSPRGSRGAPRANAPHSIEPDATGRAAACCARTAGKSSTRTPMPTRDCRSRLQLTQPDLEVRIVVLDRQ